LNYDFTLLAAERLEKKRLRCFFCWAKKWSEAECFAQGVKGVPLASVQGNPFWISLYIACGFSAVPLGTALNPGFIT